jgi:hypothetical protein
MQTVRLLWSLTSDLASAAGELRNIAGHHARSLTAPKAEKDFAQRAALDAEAAAQCGLIRDIVGNPFRPVTFDAEWRSSECFALASAIYKTRAFDRMPELAAALAQAGCTTEQILDHCRDSGPHVRGCWLVDMILATE